MTDDQGRLLPEPVGRILAVQFTGWQTVTGSAEHG